MATAPTNNNYSPMVDAVTTQQFMRGEFINVKKRNVILSKLEEKGNIKFDASGKFLERNARIGEYSSNYRADLVSRAFNRLNLRVTYAIPYSVRETTGVLGEQDIMYNSGPEALIRLNQVMMRDMGEDFRRQLSTELLGTNGLTVSSLGIAAATATPVPFFGLPTMFGSGTTQNYNPDTQATTGAISAADKEALPNCTYCGISTHPTNAIAGVDNKVNESTSPVLVNWSSTAFPGASALWSVNCIDVVDHMLNRLSRSSDPKDIPDLGIMTRTMFTQFCAKVIANSRVIFSADAQAPDVRVYKDNVIPYGPASFVWDAAQVANLFYFLNTNYLEFNLFPQKSMRLDDQIGGDIGEMGEMFYVKTQYSIEQGGHMAVAGMAGQLWGNPKFQGAALNFA